MTFIICIALTLNFISLHQNLKDRNYGWTLLSVGAIVCCLWAIAGCTTVTQSNSSNVNRTIQEMKK